VLAPELMLSEVATQLWKLASCGNLNRLGSIPTASADRTEILVDQIEPQTGHLQVEALCSGLPS